MEGLMSKRFTGLVALSVAGLLVGAASCVSNSNAPAPSADAGPGNEDAAGSSGDSGPSDAAASDATKPPTDTGAPTDATGTDSASSDGSIGNPNGISLPGTPGLMAANQTTMKFYVPYYVSASKTRAIAVIDAKTGTVSATIAADVSAQLAIDETSNLIYAPIYVPSTDGGQQTTAIAVIDGTTNAVTSTFNQTIGQAFDAGAQESLWGVSFTAVDPVAGMFYAYLQDGFGNGYLWQYSTSGTLSAAINTPGAEPGYGGGLAIDPSLHKLWAVGGSYSGGSGITVVDTQTFTVSSSYTFPANASDVETDSVNGDAVMVFPVLSDGGTPTDAGIVQVNSLTANPFPLPAGMLAEYVRVLGQEAAVFATDVTGNYYILAFDAPDGGGAWSYQGSSPALSLPPPSFGLTSTGPYGFTAVSDGTKIYALGQIDYLNTGVPLPVSSVQYWTMPIP
jgi:hypothetical protein